jgi:hypothetical protein
MAEAPLASKSAPVRMELTAESQRTLHKLVEADVKADLRKQMMVATQPLVPAVKAAALHKIHAPGTRRNKASLSSQVANAVSRSIKMTARQIVASINLTAKGNLSNLARVVEGEIPWRHPTFGHDPEVDQPKRPFFYATLAALIPTISREIEKVLDEVEKKLLCLLFASRRALTAELLMSGFSMA